MLDTLGILHVNEQHENAQSKMTVKWSEIAASIPGRMGKQCRERWFNHLNPELTKAPWTDEEDGILFHAQVMNIRTEQAGIVWKDCRSLRE